MKIGILTFHSAENYGAFLQTFASQKLLENIYSDATIEVVDYNPAYIKNTYKIYIPHYQKGENILKFMRYFLINLYFCPKRLLRKHAFHREQQFLNLSKDFATLEKENPQYDFLYLGSDQIWNANITKGVDKIYYGQISSVYQCRRVAYAVSVGETVFCDEWIQKIKEYVAQIENVSLRETYGAEFLQTVTGKSYPVVLDPTLMHTKRIWDHYAKPFKHKKKYILIYQLSDNEKLWEDAFAFAEKYNLDIICLQEIGSKRRKSNVKVISKSTLSPLEFISAIQNAEMIFTDSFHGTCFSIIYHKLFNTYLGIKRNERITELLNTLGLNKRIIRFGANAEKMLIEQGIDYNAVDDNLNRLREKSKEFLIESIV